MRAPITFLLFAFALSLCLLSVQAGTCGSSGTMEDSYCNCFGGYSPDYTQGVDNCAVVTNVKTSTLSGCLSGNVDTDVISGNYAPALLDETAPVKFHKDRLVISFTQPIVHKPWYRHETYINLVGSTDAATCSYPGPLWVKTSDPDECVDVYEFNMPWSTKSVCGFTQTGSSSSLSYAATIEFSYVVNSTYVSRTVSNLFDFNVQVERQQWLSPSLNVISDDTSDASVVAIVVGGSAYDLLAGQTKVLFQTQTTWPYKVVSPLTTPSGDSPTASSTPTGTTAVVDPDYFFPDDCPTDPDSLCTQQFEATISPTSSDVCNLEGDYVFSTELVCADVETCTAVAGPNIVITLDDTDICSPSMVDTGTLTTQSLLSYSDAELTNPKSDFETGDKTYWSFVVVDPVVSVDSVTLNSVTLTSVSDSSTDTVYTVGETPSSAFSGLTEANTGAVYSPNTPISISFELTLSRSALVNTIGTVSPSDTLKTISMEVSVDISYHGNKKRSIIVPVSPANNGVASSVANFVVRAKSHGKVFNKRSVNNKSVDV